MAKKLVEHNALVQAIEMGTGKQEVMERFGYKTSNTLKTAYLDALIALEKVPPLNNKRKKKEVDKTVKINGRGSIVIPKNLVEMLGLNEIDLFRIEKSNGGISLKPVAKKPKTILRKNNRSARK